jgi:type III secretory pathway component EscV
MEKVEPSLSTTICQPYIPSGQCVELTDPTIITRILLPCAAILALLAKSEQTGAQQTIVTSVASVVVVLIPGFPIESILVGLMAGLITLVLVRLRRRHWPTRSVGK